MAVFNTKPTIHHLSIKKKTYIPQRRARMHICNYNISTQSICNAAYRPTVHIYARTFVIQFSPPVSVQ